MNLNVIAAVALNGVIGDSRTNTIPWHLPADLFNFKRVTADKTVVMGRKTFESIGRPLPKRKNIVITSDPQFRWRHKVITYPTLAEALSQEDGDVFAIGGQRIYEEACSLRPATFYITVVDADPEGDVKFPYEGWQFKGGIFMPSGCSTLYYNRYTSAKLHENGYDYCFTEFSKDPPPSY